MTGSKYANHPLVRFVRSLPGEYYLTKEAAELLGVDGSQLTYIAKHSPTPLGPTHQFSYGAIPVRLYTRERIDEIEAYLAKRTGAQSGTPAIWSRTESRDRKHKLVQVRDNHDRAAAATAAGDLEKAAEFERRAAATHTALKKQRAKRLKELGR